jgi:hypothetical protein
MADGPSFGFYEIVKVQTTPETVGAGIAGKVAAVLGVSEPEVEGQPFAYAIGGHDLEQTYMVSAEEVESMRGFGRRSDYYLGAI